jgi:hypothetical protein
MAVRSPRETAAKEPAIGHLGHLGQPVHPHDKWNTPLYNG